MIEITNLKQAKELYEEDWSAHDYHGGPFDRGRADSYYRRAHDAHKYLDGTYNGSRVRDLTDEEKRAYDVGYALQEWEGDHKEWM